MSKLENPYSKMIDEINEAVSLHKIEANRIARDVVENKLEENLKKYINDPMVAEIRAQKKISEDDQGYLDMNIFTSTYHKNKLDLSKNYDRDYKKFLVLVDQYKTLIQQRITQFELNASLLAKFTKEELQNNPKLNKMMQDAPEGFDQTKKKFIKADAELSKNYADYISRNSEDYAQKLYEFLDESKQFRKQFMSRKQAEIDALKEKPAEVIETKTEPVQVVIKPADFEQLKSLIKANENVSNDVFSEIKSLASKVFTPQQLAELNSFEETIRNEYAKSNTSDSFIKRRLDTSYKQFRKGVDRITDMIVETGNSKNLLNSILVLINEIMSRPVEEVKNDPAYINLIIGYACGIKKYVNEADIKRGLFRKTDSSVANILEESDKFINYLINVIGVDEMLLGNNMLGTMITNDKVGEVSYALLNNASNISHTADITNWEEGANKVVTQCISSMILLLEQGNAPTQAIMRFKEQYLTKETEETKEDEVSKTRARTHVKQEDQTSTIKRILQ